MKTRRTTAFRRRIVSNRIFPNGSRVKRKENLITTSTSQSKQHPQSKVTTFCTSSCSPHHPPILNIESKSLLSTPQSPKAVHEALWSTLLSSSDERSHCQHIWTMTQPAEAGRSFGFDRKQVVVDAA